MSTFRWTYPLLLLSFVAFTACGGGGDQQAKTKTDAEQAAGQQQTQTSQQGQAAGGAVSVLLSPKNQSGIEGEARIRPKDDSLQVELLLQGISPGQRYPAHVHRGSCAAGGGVAAALSSVSGKQEPGTSTTTIAASAVPADTSYFIQAHLSDGTPAACGNVPVEAFEPAGGM